MNRSSHSQTKQLLKLLNLLADFDGLICPQAATLLEALRQQHNAIPPLYADVFGLPAAATCAELVCRVEVLSPEQRAVASYAFQIFWSYEQMLRVETARSAEQQSAYESQLQQVRRRVLQTKQVLAEVLRET